MITRRQGREWALQLLCQFDMNPPESVESAFLAFWDQQAEIEAEEVEADEHVVHPAFTSDKPVVRASLEEIRAFAEERAAGAWAEREKIDAELQPFLDNWSIYRLGTIERNSLRLGVWEILHHPEIPAPILVNETVDIVKFFSATKSGRFVNAVIDHYAKARAAAAPTEFTP